MSAVELPDRPGDRVDDLVANGVNDRWYPVLPSRLLADAGDSHAVLDRAIASGGPALVEVDCEAVGPMPVPFVPPVPVPDP